MVDTVTTDTVVTMNAEKRDVGNPPHHVVLRKRILKTEITEIVAHIRRNNMQHRGLRHTNHTFLHCIPIVSSSGSATLDKQEGSGTRPAGHHDKNKLRRNALWTCRLHDSKIQATQLSSKGYCNRGAHVVSLHWRHKKQREVDPPPHSRQTIND